MRVKVQLLVALCVVLACGCEPRRPVRQAPTSRLDGALARREQELAEAQRKLVELLGREKQTTTSAARPLDTSRALAEVRRLRKALARITLTEPDTSALRAYCHGKLAQAEDLFKQSERTRPGRAFPAYFLGVIALERGRPGQARTSFRLAAGREPECRSARLLARLADRWPARRQPSAAELSVMFERACRDAADELGLNWPREAAVVEPFGSPLLADPVLLKAQEVVGQFVRDDLWDLAYRMVKARDPAEKLKAVLAMGENVFADALLHTLARDFPDARRLQTFVFLYRNFVRRPSQAADFSEELAAARERDPDNGALILLGVNPGRTVGGERSYPPLSEAELAEFRRGVRASRLETFAAFGREEAERYRRERFGPFASAIGPVPLPFIHTRLAHVARRAAATVGLLLKEGNTDEALKLASDVETLAERLLAESKEARARLVADAILDALYETMGDYAARAGKKPLLLTCLERRAEVCRRRAERMVAWDPFLVTMSRTPVPRLAEAGAQVGRSTEAIAEVFRRKLAAEPERHFERAMAVLSGMSAESAPAGAGEWLVVLAELRNRNAVPLLIRLAGHRDPLIAHLATAAFKATAEGKR